MARLLVKPQFDPELPIVALRPFIAGGKSFKPGDLVPKPDGPRQFRVFRAMYEMNKIKNMAYDDLHELVEAADDLDKITDMPTLRKMCAAYGVKPSNNKEVTKQRLREARKDK